MATSTLITAASDFPVSVDEAKSHLRVEVADDDALISTLIQSATGFAEEFLRRRLMVETWEDWLDGFADEMILRNSPAPSVTSIAYVDSAGITQTLDSSTYTVEAPAGPNPSRTVVRLAYGQSWPATRDQANAVRVRYSAGYANAAAVPPAIRSAILLTIGHLYGNREDVVVGTIAAPLPRGADYLLRPYRLWEFR